MRIRKFRLEDSVEVARLHRNTIRFVNSKNYSKKTIDVWSGNTSAKKFRDSMKRFYRYVAVIKNRIVGFSDFTQDGELSGFYVHKDFQGMGVGKVLIAKIETEATKQGIEELRVNSSITAKEFYESQGYKILKKDPCGCTINGHSFTSFRMKKKLN